MSDASFSSSVPGTVISPLNTEAEKILHTRDSAPVENQKIEKSARDFESLLLSSWLQQAEQSFASVPGADDDPDADPGKDQLQGIAMQSLGQAMTVAGGIGIAKMISSQLHKTADRSLANPTAPVP